MPSAPTLEGEPVDSREAGLFAGPTSSIRLRSSAILAGLVATKGDEEEDEGAVQKGRTGKPDNVEEGEQPGTSIAGLQYYSNQDVQHESGGQADDGEAGRLRKAHLLTGLR